MIITLAGHVDHGKTTLVRHLTGVDTDRLEEEKKRGLTIDLGFAYADAGQLGFVDVPGHQKFIHNMVAGIASHQHALFVIAADDGPMPQSREHLDILQLIGLQQGTVALTKCDRVSAERLAQCREEISNLLSDSFLQDAPIFQTSIESPDGFEVLLAHLRERAKADQQRATNKPFRLAIDRSFTVKGAGLVVTGTAHSGTVSVDQQLYHYPSGELLRVRSIRAQDNHVTTAQAGERCALNLAGADGHDIGRGQWLTQQPSQGHRSLTLRFTVSKDFPRSIKHWMPVHVYHATVHSTARLATYPSSIGSDNLVDVLCDVPLACHRGDRVILRDQGLDQTMGGGEVVYAEAEQSQRRNAQARRNQVLAYSQATPDHAFDQLLKLGPLDSTAFQQLWQISDAQFADLCAGYELRQIDNTFLRQDHWAALKSKTIEQLQQAAKTQGQGIRENQLAQIDPAFRQTLLNELVQEQAAVQAGGLYRLAEVKVQLPNDLATLWEQAQPLLAQKQAPSTGDLAKQLQQPQHLLEKQFNELVKHGLLINVANHRYYPKDTLQEVAQDVMLLAGRAKDQEGFSVREFRDHTGIGRNVAIEVLEYFDGRGFTQRVGNARVVRRPYQ